MPEQNDRSARLSAMDSRRMTAPNPSRRSRSRIGLYAPVVLLLLLALGWSGFWFYARGRTMEAIDVAIAREAERGRNWSCGDRSIGGFPFRIELRCASLALTSSRWPETVRVETGPAVAVGQIYTPGQVILQATGPLRATLPEGRILDVTWTRLEASLTHRSPEQFALVATEPNLNLTAPGAAPSTWRAATLELHLRRNPDRPEEEQAVDLALTANGTALPELDSLLGTKDLGTVDLRAVVTKADSFRLGFNPDALESWRGAGGGVEIARLNSTKGPARIEASGRLLLDQTHRVAGQVQAGVAGIDQIGGIRIGGLTAGLGGLLGGKAPASGAPGLTALPAVVLREGRVYLGPFRLPLPPLQPLY